MSLELFINSERTSNSDYFYREISNSPYAATLRLSATSELPAELLSSNYIATYYLNGNSSSSVLFDVDRGIDLYFQRNLPCVSSVCLSLSGIDGTFLQEFCLSVKFVTKFPKVTFIAYPSTYIDEQTFEQKTLTSANFTKSPGVWFYGEGHTEIFNLSSTSENFNSQTVINWYVGNELSDFTHANVSTKIPLLNEQNATTVVSITSQPNIEQKISLTLYATNDEITKEGPVIGYDDVTGKKFFYPFFQTTLNIDVEYNNIVDKFKDNIHIKKYPNTKTFNFISPFVSNQISLVNQLEPQKFRASLNKNVEKQLLTCELSSTTWNLKEYSDLADWDYQTKELKQITDYVFPLSYDNQTDLTNVLKLFTVPATEKSSLILSVSALQTTQLNYPPYDWKPRDQMEVHSTDLIEVMPLPFVELFVHNYFVVKHAAFPIKSLNVYANKNCVLQKVQLYTNESTNVYELSSFSSDTFATLNFKKLGKKTIFVKSFYKDITTNTFFDITNSFIDIVEVVSKYDETTSIENAFNYRTKTTELPFTYSLSSAPLIVPNEWFIENNINYPIKQIYNLIENIALCCDYYQQHSKFLGWFGNSKLTWSNLECFPDSTSRSEWAKYVIKQTLDQPETIPLIWNDQNCITKVVDPTCFQKYCIEWKWSSRTREVSDLIVTWKTAKGSDIYQKKWKFESCELDPTSIICETGRWNKPAYNEKGSPVLTIGINSKQECFTKGFVKTKDNIYILARETEIIAITDSEIPEIIAKLEIADEIFAFSKIEKISLNSNGNLYVLDSQIPRVSILELRANKFKHLNSWGTFGSKSSLYGFYKPNDLHIDQNQYVWITDTGNKCIKKYTSTGKYVQTVFDEKFNTKPPLSLTIDSKNNLHVLTYNSIMLFGEDGFIKEYLLPPSIIEPTKINCSYNREILFVTHKNGVFKYFRNDNEFGNLISNLQSTNGSKITNFVDVFQDEYRNVFICVEDKVLKIADRMKAVTNKANVSEMWSIDDILIKDADYIQPLVYLNSLHKLWDNIELLRNSLFYYNNETQTKYVEPRYKKEDLIIGQNELVTHSVINRLISQLWTNLSSLVDYVLPKS
jgi:hypothetical protein